MRRPRGLLPDEAELWSRVAQTVRPLVPPRKGEGGISSQVPRNARETVVEGPESLTTTLDKSASSRPLRLPGGLPPPRSGEERKRPLDRHGLDGSWERKLAKAEVSPDFTLDLHGHGLDAAYARLDHGLAQAMALGARVVLVITGKPRPVDAADRGTRRGAIRAKLLDWLAHGSHASKIAAVRGAHRKHGGAGAVYVILKRPK
jgi:DNA-nicking Smr family endonuclease